MKRSLPLLFSLGLLVALLVAGSAQQPAARAQEPTPTPEPRIVGGTQSLPGAWPAVVALLSPTYGQFCAGNLIAPTWVLTAAHCVNAAPNVFVLSNTNDLSSGGTSISIVQQIPHPNYNAATDAYDFGLIQLASAAPVATMSMVTQADATLTQAGDWATVIGWGHTQEGCCPSNLLRQVSVPIVDDATCNSQYGGGIDFVSMLCAGDAGIDSCQGDSGGPLMVQRPSGQWIQAGVVSTGFGCARPNFPGIYAEVLAGLNWINQMIGSTPGPTPSPTPFPFPTSPPSPKPTATPGATSTPNPTAPPTAPPGPTTPPSVPVKPTPPGSGPTPTPAPTGQPAPTPTPTPTPTPFNPCALKPGACQ